MKKILSTILFLVIFILGSIPAISQEKIDLTGTWEGTVYIAGIDIEMELILVLNEKDGTLSGKITGDWGYIDCDLMEPKRENNSLSFKGIRNSFLRSPKIPPHSLQFSPTDILE